jgi:hypothetical protein
MYSASLVLIYFTSVCIQSIAGAAVQARSRWLGIALVFAVGAGVFLLGERLWAPPGGAPASLGQFIGLALPYWGSCCGLVAARRLGFWRRVGVAMACGGVLSFVAPVVGVGLVCAWTGSCL